MRDRHVLPTWGAAAALRPRGCPCQWCWVLRAACICCRAVARLLGVVGGRECVFGWPHTHHVRRGMAGSQDTQGYEPHTRPHHRKPPLGEGASFVVSSPGSRPFAPNSKAPGPKAFSRSSWWTRAASGPPNPLVPGWPTPPHTHPHAAPHTAKASFLDPGAALPYLPGGGKGGMALCVAAHALPPPLVPPIAEKHHATHSLRFFVTLSFWWGGHRPRAHAPRTAREDTLLPCGHAQPWHVQARQRRGRLFGPPVPTPHAHTTCTCHPPPPPPQDASHSPTRHTHTGALSFLSLCVCFKDPEPKERERQEAAPSQTHTQTSCCAQAPFPKPTPNTHLQP